MFQADLCFWGSGVLDNSGHPYISFGLRRIGLYRNALQHLRCDVHSAMAAIIDSPVWRLLNALTSLRDAWGHITIDGLDAHVLPVSAEDRERLVPSDFDLGYFRELYGVKEFLLESDPRGTHGAAVLLPIVEHLRHPLGLYEERHRDHAAGSLGQSVDLRLVPDLTPELVVSLLRAHLDARGFDDVELLLKCAIPGLPSPAVGGAHGADSPGLQPRDFPCRAVVPADDGGQRANVPCLRAAPVAGALVRRGPPGVAHPRSKREHPGARFHSGDQVHRAGDRFVRMPRPAGPVRRARSRDESLSAPRPRGTQPTASSAPVSSIRRSRAPSGCGLSSGSGIFTPFRTRTAVSGGHGHGGR